jgi:phosphatidyl-myo-inositol dimannoside synthase
MRVLLITPDYPPDHGGIQRLLHMITTSMSGDTETRVLTMSTRSSGEFDASARQSIKRLHRTTRVPSLQNLIFNALAVLQTPSWRPDVILNGHVVTAPAATLLSRRFRCPVVLYCYGKEVQGRPRLAKWALTRSSGGVAVAEFTRDQLRQACGGTLARPVDVVHPGVDVPTAPRRKTDSRPTVVTTGRLRDWYKGHDVMLDAIASLRADIGDVHWVVIGDGRLREELEGRSRRLGLEANVTFLGARERRCVRYASAISEE